VKKEPKSVWRVLVNPKIDSYYLRQSGIPSAQEDAAPSPRGQLRLPRPPGFLTLFSSRNRPSYGVYKRQCNRAPPLSLLLEDSSPSLSLYSSPLHPLVSSPSYLTCQAIKAPSSQD